MAKQNLDYTKIRAKINGRMSRTLIDAGNLVKVDETVLTTIVSLDPIYVTFGVDEHLLRRVHTYVRKGTAQADAGRQSSGADGAGQRGRFSAPGVR